MHSYRQPTHALRRAKALSVIESPDVVDLSFLEGARFPMADLVAGQTVKGLVKRVVKGKGVVMDVGADKDGFLPVMEFRDGFPTNQDKLREKSLVDGVRVLSIDPKSRRFFLTLRTGSLERPERELLASLRGDVQPFAGLPADTVFDAEVVSMTFDAVFVCVSPPNGGDPVSAILQQIDFTDGFIDEIKIGSRFSVRVRFVDVARNRLTVTMRDTGLIPLADLQLGQSMEGVVTTVLPGKGVLVDVGAERAGFLGVEEYRDGFPVDDDVKMNQMVKVQVLAKQKDRFFLTRRSGGLDRPSKDRKTGDVTAFVGFEPDGPQTFEAHVNDMTCDAVWLQVTPPGGGTPALGMMLKDEFARGFEDEARPGGIVTVRLKYVDAGMGRLYFTMKDDRVMRIGDIQVGETLKGTIMSVVPRKGVLVDVGAVRPGFLPIAEYRNGFPNNWETMCPGAEVRVRVLSVEPDRFTVTRRSGDLARPQREDLSKDVRGFVDVSPDAAFDAEVSDLTLYGIWVKLDCPKTGDRVRGMIHQKNFPEGFVDVVYLGQPLRVKVLDANADESKLDLAIVESD